MNHMIPATLAQTIIHTYPGGTEWLARFPAQLARWQAHWQLELAPPFPNLSYNYVAPGMQAGQTRVVLKAGPPGMELQSEMAALQMYNGKGAVRLLDADPENGALLLEQIAPGTPLIHEPDDRRATEIAAQVMQQLWQASQRPAIDTPVMDAPVTESIQHPPHSPTPAHRFATVSEWAKGLQRLRARFQGETGPLPPRLVEKAERLFDELLANMETPVLLHGDLHHENILAARLSSTHTKWLAIDPKGVWGEPAYEPGAWLRNPMSRLYEWTNPQAILTRRLDQFADLLALDRARIAAWGFAQAILSACWSLEDHPPLEPQQISANDGWRDALAVAEWLDPYT